MNARRLFRFLALLSGSGLLVVTSLSAIPTPGDLRPAGEIDFPISCSPQLQSEFAYALARLTLGYSTPNDTSLSDQLAAGAILERLWRKSPDPSGIVHYLIHSYDYPALAQRGLPAAQAYGAIAPWVPHALHMPSHIFTRLGMWDESIAANRAALPRQNTWKQRTSECKRTEART